MIADFLPGLEPSASAPSTPMRYVQQRSSTHSGGHRPLGGVKKSAQDDAGRQFSMLAFRAEQFLRSLPRSRRLEIAARSRFRNIPWVRRCDDHDPDDCLP